MRTHGKISGNTLVIVLILMATLVAFVGVSVDYTQNVGRHSSRARTNVSAQAVGEACLELAFAQWRQRSRNTTPILPDPNSSFYTDSGPPSHLVYGNSPPATNAFANIALPTAAMFPDIPNFTATAANDPNFTVSNFKVQAIDQQFALTTADPPVSAYPAGEEPPPSVVAYNASYPASWYYLASADVTLPTPAGNVTTKMRRIFEKKIVRPTGYFMFFNDDLELSPSSPLTIYGQVHTNAKLYTGSNNLTFNSSQPALQGYGTVAVSGSGTNPNRTLGVTYNDDWIIGFKTGDTFHAAGSATAPTIAANTTVAQGNYWSMYDWDPTQWNGAAEPTNKGGPHEVIERQLTPLSTYPDPLNVPVWDAGNRSWPVKPTSMQRFYDQAGVRIEISSTNVVTIRNKSDTVLSSSTTGPGTDPLQSEYYRYRNSHDIWKTALGATPSNATIPAAKTLTGCSTTAGSPDVTCGGTVVADKGRYMTGPGIPEGAWIVDRTNSKATLSATAKANGSNLTMRLNGTTSIQDNREGGTVDLITIDFGVFKSWLPRTAYACGDNLNRYPDPTVPNSFVVHISALPATGRKRALRFVNGGSVYQYMYDSCYGAPDCFIGNQFKVQTFITDNPVYIQGDFNSSRSIAAGTDTVTPACNISGPLTTIFYNGSGGTPIPGTTRILPISRLPFYLICDSLTVLSNAWKDSNAPLALSSRVASNTTVELSLVTGNVPTSAVNGYSGGAENIIRLMENWTSKYFTFVGNIVQLYPSEQAVGKWVPPGTTGNVYTEPLRNWYWDPFSIINADDFVYAVAYRKHKWSPYP